MSFQKADLDVIGTKNRTTSTWSNRNRNMHTYLVFGDVGAVLRWALGVVITHENSDVQQVNSGTRWWFKMFF